MLRSMIFIFVRASVHYALFEDEFYLKEQLRFLRQAVQLLASQSGTRSPSQIAQPQTSASAH